MNYHIVLLSCCLFHYIYWHRAVTANQGKIWGISRNTIFFSLVTRASSCCDLGHCHSLNAVELPHFTPTRDGAGYYWRACSSCFCQQDVTAQLAKFMKKIKFSKFWKWITTGLKHMKALKKNGTDFNYLISLVWYWHPWVVSLIEIGHMVNAHDWKFCELHICLLQVSGSIVVPVLLMPNFIETRD